MTEKNRQKKHIPVKIILALIILGFLSLAAYKILGSSGKNGPSSIPGMGTPGAAARGSAAPETADGNSAALSPFGFQGNTEQNVIAVKTAAVKTGTVNTHLRLHGDVAPKSRVNVYPDTSGILIRFTVNTGDTVNRGSIIAYIDPGRPGENYSASPVTSPVAGTIISLPVEQGDKITTSTVVASVGDLSSLRIETAVPERYIGVLKKGLAAVMTFEPYGEEEFTGKISQISPVLDTASRTNAVTLEPDRPDERIKAGMFATIRLIIEERKNTLYVPKEALSMASGSYYAYVVEEENTASKRTVNLGLIGEDRAEVLSGLAVGDTVVLQGQSLLSDGSKVRIIE